MSKDRNNRHLDLYKKMLYIRTVEEWVADNYVVRNIRCPIHLSLGQEASAVGIMDGLDLDGSTLIFSTHRSHAHYLAKGGGLREFLAELMGFSQGCCGGRGGSMHLHDHRVGMISSLPIVGSVLPLATGYAHANSLNDENRTVVVFFGDGAFEEGVVHECFNYAVLHRLKILFVCENNLFSCFTRIDKRQPDRPLMGIPIAHGLRTWRIDEGNDVIKVADVASEISDYVNGENRPAFVEILTYRLVEHCGTKSDDHLNYRSCSELAYWIERDCLKLVERGLCGDTNLDQFEREVKLPYVKSLRAELDDISESLSRDPSSRKYAELVVHK